MIRAVVFDMDGTLLDTQRIYNECWRYAAKETNFQGNIDEDVIGFSGMNRTDAIAYFKKKYGKDFDPIPMMDLRLACEAEMLGQMGGIQRKPGICEALKQLKILGIRTAVATGSSRERTESYLGAVGLLEAFDAIITGEEVTYSKPHPEIFWLAADALDCPPEECVIVEDSYNGIRAGYAAGMHAVLIPDTQQPIDEIRPLLWQCIDTLDQLPQLILEENKN